MLFDYSWRGGGGGGGARRVVKVIFYILTQTVITGRIPFSEITEDSTHTGCMWVAEKCQTCRDAEWDACTVKAC
jgi:hypothetical protein